MMPFTLLLLCVHFLPSSSKAIYDQSFSSSRNAVNNVNKIDTNQQNLNFIDYRHSIYLNHLNDRIQNNQVYVSKHGIMFDWPSHGPYLQDQVLGNFVRLYPNSGILVHFNNRMPDYMLLPRQYLYNMGRGQVNSSPFNKGRTEKETSINGQDIIPQDLNGIDRADAQFNNLVEQPKVQNNKASNNNLNKDLLKQGSLSSVEQKNQSKKLKSTTLTAGSIVKSEVSLPRNINTNHKTDTSNVELNFGNSVTLETSTSMSDSVQTTPKDMTSIDFDKLSAEIDKFLSIDTTTDMPILSKHSEKATSEKKTMVLQKVDLVSDNRQKADKSHKSRLEKPSNMISKSIGKKESDSDKLSAQLDQFLSLHTKSTDKPIQETMKEKPLDFKSFPDQMDQLLTKPASIKEPEISKGKVLQVPVPKPLELNDNKFDHKVVRQESSTEAPTNEPKEVLLASHAEHQEISNKILAPLTDIFGGKDLFRPKIKVIKLFPLSDKQEALKRFEG